MKTYYIFNNISLKGKCFQTKFAEKIKTRILCSVTSFFLSKIVTFMW
jgi:hypothetical protein